MRSISCSIASVRSRWATTSFSAVLIVSFFVAVPRISLARRSPVPLVPLAVTGAFQVLQRGAWLPHYAPLCVVVGERMSPEFVASLSDEQLLAELSDRLNACHQRALSHTRHVAGLKL